MGRPADRSVNTAPDDDERRSADPAVDLRTVLFTVAGHELLVALEPDGTRRSLPRAVPTRGESLDLTSRRIIRDSTRLTEQYIEQLYTLSVNDPTDRWTIIVSYLALICSGASPQRSEAVTWQPVVELGGLTDADRMVIDYALVRLRAKLGYTTIAFHLLPETFTLTELQHAYETILDQRLDKRNFRRRMIASGIVSSTDDKRREGSHRPATLYRFRAEHDAAAYLTPPWAQPNDGAPAP